MLQPVGETLATIPLIVGGLPGKTLLQSRPEVAEAVGGESLQTTMMINARERASPIPPMILMMMTHHRLTTTRIPHMMDLMNLKKMSEEVSKPKQKKNLKVKTAGNVRVKEADHIKITQLPRVDQIRAFKNMMRQEVTSCSGRGDAAFMWMLEIENPGTTFESLAKSGKKFESIDCKLASALTKACNSTELAQEIVALTEQEAREGRNIKGRQILFWIYEFYQTEEQAGQLFSILDLSKVHFKNDKQLSKFILTWEGVLTGMKEAPNETQKELMFLEQIRRSEVLLMTLLLMIVQNLDRQSVHTSSSAHPPRTI